MPQMMPINWILYFFLFIIIFILFNILNYYIFLYKNNKKLNNKYLSLKIKYFIWKW